LCFVPEDFRCLTRFSTVTKKVVGVFVRFSCAIVTKFRTTHTHGSVASTTKASLATFGVFWQKRSNDILGSATGLHDVSLASEALVENASVDGKQRV
jgi:hypothetical protein